MDSRDSEVMALRMTRGMQMWRWGGGVLRDVTVRWLQDRFVLFVTLMCSSAPSTCDFPRIEIIQLYFLTVQYIYLILVRRF